MEGSSSHRLSEGLPSCKSQIRKEETRHKTGGVELSYSLLLDSVAMGYGRYLMA
jgi:hypothetical protein